MRPKAVLLIANLLAASCGVSGERRDASDPDWKVYRSAAAKNEEFAGDLSYKPRPDIFVFRDLKSEGDVSLARRLLGAAGQRIVHIDRHRDRWQYYEGDDDPIHDIVLYSKPESWGSAYGICRSEKYEISFAEDGKIGSVTVTPRYGVEGPIFQKDGFDWGFFRTKMCETVPGNHTPSYFPADDVIEAHDLAILLAKAIDLAGKAGDLPYRLNCKTHGGEVCSTRVREYLSKLKLNEIDHTSKINCPYPRGPKDTCFTVTVGENRLGPFPKKITIQGSTYMNNWVVHSVEVRESFTIS